MNKAIIGLFFTVFSSFALANEMATLEQCNAFAKFQVAKNYLNMGKGKNEYENKLIGFQYNFFIRVGYKAISKAEELKEYDERQFDSNSNTLLYKIIAELDKNKLSMEQITKASYKCANDLGFTY